MFCVRCGNQIYPGQKFCPKCGYPVENHPDPPRKEMDFRENGTADTYSPYEREYLGQTKQSVTGYILHGVPPVWLCSAQYIMGFPALFILGFPHTTG